MHINFTSTGATLRVTEHEFALFNEALNVFLQFYAMPGHRAADIDIDMANRLEQQMFNAYCQRDAVAAREAK